MQNLEIKCRFVDHPFARRVAIAQLGAEYRGRLSQTDTYFNVRTGRLKLRQNKLYARGRGHAPEVWTELIAYRRTNRAAPRTSRYHLLNVEDAPGTAQFFAEAFGVLVRVSKMRELYVADNLRVHLDTVAGLGKFLEFELIVRGSHSGSQSPSPPYSGERGWGEGAGFCKGPSPSPPTPLPRSTGGEGRLVPSPSPPYSVRSTGGEGRVGDHSLRACRREMARLLAIFQVPRAAFVRYSYADLLIAKQPS
jgi:adenylate cyclase class 2